MLQQVETLFENMTPMLKVSKKKVYEENMKNFREKNNEFFFQLMDWIKGENKEVVARKLSVSFVDAVKQLFEKNGKRKALPVILNLLICTMHA